MDVPLFWLGRGDGGRFGEFKGASNSKELHVMLTGTIMIRRLKKDVLSQLPPKIRQVCKAMYDAVPALYDASYVSDKTD